jgi:PAS domain S-box-containing protein
MAVLQEAESQFRILAETMPQLVWTTDPEGYHDYFNRRLYEFTGLKPHEAIGDGWMAVVHPDDRARVREEWQRALATGKLYEIELRLRGADRRYHWFLGRALPIRDSAGHILRWFGTYTDIEGQKRAEEALWRLDEQHRLALEAAEMGTWDLGLASGIVSWDERSCALFGIAANELRSLSLEETLQQIHPEDQPRARERIAAAIDPRSDGRYENEYRIVLPDGRVRWVHARGQARFAGEGAARRATRLSGVISDVTQRRSIEEAQHLLTRELNHRVKNLFAIASGMVSMTARTAKTTKEMAEALRGRLGALSRAHELVRPVLASDHQGGHATALEKLIASILEPYAHGGSLERLRLNGPAVAVGSNTATSLALVLHELATNAAKYGSLSVPEGTLAIEWSLGADHVALAWTERNGPAIPHPPTFEGFGSLLSRKSIAGQLGGTLDFDWRPEGLVVEMRLPTDRLAH